MAKDYNSLFKTKEEAQAFIRKVLGPPRRKIEGTEYEHVRTLVLLAKPSIVSNDQRSYNEIYDIGDTRYSITYFDDETLIEEILKDN